MDVGACKNKYERRAIICIELNSPDVLMEQSAEVCLFAHANQAMSVDTRFGQKMSL